MVINIRLSSRTAAQSDDPLGRSWYGYDPVVTPDQLWANKRGDWNLDANHTEMNNQIPTIDAVSWCQLWATS